MIITIQNFKPKIHEEYYTNENYPIYATEWIKENLDLENIKLFNEYNYGSYLLFHGVPVMIDSRADLYSPEFNSKNDIFMDVQNIGTGTDDYKETFSNYGITHVLTYSDSNVASKMKKNSNYKKIYPDPLSKIDDDRFVIYERVNINEIEKDDEENKAIE